MSGYVGWTCGKCGGPVAGRFSVCERCGAPGDSRLLSRPGPTPNNALAEISNGELRQLVDLLRHLRGGDDGYERERLKLMARLMDEQRARTGAQHQGEAP